MKIRLNKKFRYELKENGMVEEFRKDTGLELDSIIETTIEKDESYGEIIECFVITCLNGEKQLIPMEYGEIIID